ncbi:hypothetical protein ACGDLY_001300 [Vibrio campbellii]
MKNKTLMLIGFAIISTNANSIEKQLVVNTTIDINNLYTDSITNVEFEPASLELEVRDDHSGFEIAVTKMKISTNIPMDVSSVSYTSTLIENNAICKNFSGEAFSQSSFVTVQFDGNAAALDLPIVINDFNSNDGVSKYSEHDLILSFESFSDIEMDGAPRECTGDLTFSVGVDI